MALVNVRVQSIIYDDLYKSPVLILKESAGNGVIPLWIGKKEADLLNDMAFNDRNGKESLFPSLGDSMLYFIEKNNASIKRFVLERIENSLYRGYLFVKENMGYYKLFCRPTDGIAMAIRANAALYARENLVSFVNDEDNMEKDYSYYRRKNEIRSIDPADYCFV